LVYEKTAITSFRRQTGKSSQTVHTITSDNGSEFAEHEFIAKKLKA
jgi:IS30 family transposase